MAGFALAHALHVLAVLVWIGGVAFVTLVLIPALRDEPATQRMARFHHFEGRFAPIARACVLVAGASGAWMVHAGAMAYRFAEPGFWWMHAMVAVWLAFAAMLFVIEPLGLHRRMAASPDPARDFARLSWAHRVLLALSLIAVAGAAAGAHGLAF